jgi:NAD(P)-dependent dehydrogenase (short-subunit alcohol dehydrogenase family)
MASLGHGRDYTGDSGEGKGFFFERGAASGAIEAPLGGAAVGLSGPGSGEQGAVRPAAMSLQNGRHGRAAAGRYLTGKRKRSDMRALVLGASGGIGGALVTALQARGEVLGLSRRGDGLEITDETSVAAVLGAVDGPFDLIVVATGALVIDGVGPEKTLKALTADGLLRQFNVNAVGPALVMKHAVRLMPRERLARLAVLSARVGSIGDNALGGWYGYRAAKAALNQLVHTAAIEAARTHPHSVLVALHPGTVETGLAPAQRAGHPSVSAAVAAVNLLSVLDKLGPADSGGFFDWQGKAVPW